MTKADARGLLKQRLKLIRGQLFGANPQWYTSAPIYQDLVKKHTEAQGVKVTLVAEKYEKDLEQLQALVKYLDEAAKSEGVTLGGVHGPIEFRGRGAGDVQKQLELMKQEFDIESIRLEENLLAKYTTNKDQVDEFISTLPSSEAMLETLLSSVNK